MPQADAENGHLTDELLHRGGDLRHILRVSGAVGEEHPVGLHEENLLGGGVVGDDGHVAAPPVQAADDVQLDAAVDGDHVVFCVGGAGVPALPAAYPMHRVVGHRGFRDPLQCFLHAGLRGGDQHPPAAQIPDAPCKLAGVHPGNAGDIVLLQKLRQGLDAAEIGGIVIIIINHQAADAGDLAFVVLFADAVVANQRIGHYHHLIRVGKVGYDLLIARHGGVEHDFAYPVLPAAKAVAVVLAAILQDDFAVELSHCNASLPHSKKKTRAFICKGKYSPCAHERPCSIADYNIADIVCQFAM